MCTLNGYKEKDVNKVRWPKFRDTHKKQNKVIDMSALPPCKENLKLHSAHANYVAKTHSQTVWLIYFSILYLMKMITNLVANARRAMIIRRTHKNIKVAFV